VNDDFFQVIDTEEKAYILGLLYADGTIRKRKGDSYVVRIGLNTKDIDLLYNINKFLSEYPVRQYDRPNKHVKSGIQQISELSITSTRMYNDLLKLGVHENKSLTLNFPTENQVPKHLIHHFIRGYFDGDGSVYVFNRYNNARKKTYVTIESCTVGTLEFLSEMSNVLSICDICVKKEKRTVTNCYKYKLTGNVRCIKFYNFLYKDATIYLERKKEIFDNYFKERRSETIIAPPTNNLEEEGIVRSL